MKIDVQKLVLPSALSHVAVQIYGLAAVLQFFQPDSYRLFNTHCLHDILNNKRVTFMKFH